MKILVLKNYIQHQDILDKGIAMVKLKLIPVKENVIFDQIDFNRPLTSVPVHTNVVSNGYIVNHSDFEGVWNIGYDAILLIYDWSKISPQPTNPADGGASMQIPEQWYNGQYPEVLCTFILHEMAHIDNPDNPDLVDSGFYRSKFSQESTADNFYLSILKPANINIMPTYKYFVAKEVVGLKPEFVQLLDKIRGECGFPFKINSGYRTVAQNASLSDSVSDSAHLEGLAVDVACNDSGKRDKIVSVCKANGIVRLGLANTFVHIDISKTLPQNVIWLYK